MAIQPDATWDKLNPTEKLESLRADLKTLSDMLHRLGYGHQNLASHHGQTAETVKEAVSELEKVAERVRQLERPQT